MPAVTCNGHRTGFYVHRRGTCRTLDRTDADGSASVVLTRRRQEYHARTGAEFEAKVDEFTARFGARRSRAGRRAPEPYERLSRRPLFSG